jgi:hypothetical protein
MNVKVCEPLWTLATTLSIRAGRTWPWQAAATTWLGRAEAGPAVTTMAPAVVAAASRPAARTARARVSFIGNSPFENQIRRLCAGSPCCQI